MSHQHHFQGKYEVELKYRLNDKHGFVTLLRQRQHEIMLEDNQEHDRHYDFPDSALQAQHKSLCIRTMTPSGIQLWIVKGPEPDRCEATNIADANMAASMLTTMGYQLVLETRKTRSIYFIGQFHITVDSLDGIGDFAEFAIMTDDETKLIRYRRELTALAESFGLTLNELETKSYRQMWMEYAKL